ncbi:MAG: DNA polymerase III subunit gamma/tau, partial [Winogradskyella sp.]|nr:DNA polymerase III subunit gamma/tau [Winogradskyella sp.]
SVDDIRSLTDQVRIPPQVGKYKVYIIDEVHMLSSSAFNAFLKTLEEPPKHCIFILATTEKHKIIPTILSRCQIFDFKRITVKDAKDYLKYIAKEQNIEAEDDALHIIAQKADGAMRDALSIFDRVVSFSGNKLTRQAVTENLNVLDYEIYFESTDLILDNKIPELLLQLNTILSKGFDSHHYITGLASHFRDLLVCKTPETVELLEVGEDTQIKYLDQSKRTTVPFLLKGIELANECDLNFKSSKNHRLLVELCIMQLASINFDGEKKNNDRFIIPPSYFKSIGINPVKVEKPVIKEKEKTAALAEPMQQTNQVGEITSAVETVVKPPEIKINKSSKSVSGLSLKSIKQKKEHQLKQLEVVINEEELPKDDVTQEQFIEAWNAYIERLHLKGEKILASILEMETPVLEGINIKITYPNETLKLELEREQYNLMGFLRKELNNFDLKLDIGVSEEVSKKYAFTPREKYDKLKEKNPNLELLKKTFGLDL